MTCYFIVSGEIRVYLVKNKSGINRRCLYVTQLPGSVKNLKTELVSITSELVSYLLSLQRFTC